MLIHLVVLTIHFRPFDLKPRNDKGPPLEVALVNAKTVAKPTKADILAQANLDGGGNTDANRRAKTPLPVLPKQAPDQQVAVATQRVEALEKQTRELMTQLRNVPVPQTLQAPTEATEKTELPTANELMQRTLEAMRLEAQIAKDMEAYQKRPKRRFIGARAEEYRFARYVEDWRMKIERIGNLNYPEAARQQKLYGSLLLTVSIRADGSVENVEINRTSGSRILDAAAVSIVEMSGPFAAVPAGHQARHRHPAHHAHVDVHQGRRCSSRSNVKSRRTGRGCAGRQHNRPHGPLRRRRQSRRALQVAADPRRRSRARPGRR